jgi:hypothetical protein
LRQFVEKLGLDSNTTEINPNEWMNQSIGIVVGTEKNLEGEMRANVRSLFAAEEAPAREEEVEEVEPEQAPPPKKVAAAGRGRRR